MFSFFLDNLFFDSSQIIAGVPAKTNDAIASKTIVAIEVGL